MIQKIVKRELIYSPEYMEFAKNSNKRTQEKLMYATEILNTEEIIMKKDTKKLTVEEVGSLRKLDFKSQSGFVDAESVLASAAGEIGTENREEFNAKARAWYYGEILRERRKELGLTQKELAEQIGRERTYINRIEKGETDLQLSSFLRIADALGITLRLEVKMA